MKRSLLVVWLLIASFFCGNLLAQEAPGGSSASAAGLSADADSTATKIAAAAAAKAQTAPLSPAMTLLQLIKSGGWAMIPLGGMSVLMVMLLLVYLITMRPGAVVSRQFMNTAEVLLKKRDYAGLLATSSRQGEAVARVTHRTLDFAAKNPSASFEILREIAQTEGSSQAASLQNRISYMADIAVLSPMVGLFGTVVGIIHSFGVLGSNASQASRPVLLAQGVSEALVATGAGLIIGILSMMFYGLFRNRVQRLISDLERASALILGLMALHFEKQGDTRDERRETTRLETPQKERDTLPAKTLRRPSVSVDDEF